MANERGRSAGPDERDDRPRRTPDEERRRVRALTDSGIIVAMREGDTWAWGEFGIRFEPLLYAYARRIGISADVRRERVLDLLADEGMRFAEGRGAIPRQLGAYLTTALRHRHLNEKRAVARRAAAYNSAARESDPSEALRRVTSDQTASSPAKGAAVREQFVEYACSEGALRDALGPAAVTPSPSRVIEAFVHFLRHHLTNEEQQILGWEQRRVPHRQIAEWLGVSYDAATKRVWRLKRRVQALAAAHYDSVRSPEDRRALYRLFRRAGSVGVELPATKGAANVNAEEAEQ